MCKASLIKSYYKQQDLKDSIINMLRNNKDILECSLEELEFVGNLEINKSLMEKYKPMDADGFSEYYNVTGSFNLVIDFVNGMLEKLEDLERVIKEEEVLGG